MINEQTGQNITSLDEEILQLFRKRMAYAALESEFGSAPKEVMNPYALYEEMLQIAALQRSKSAAPRPNGSFERYQHALLDKRDPVSDPRIVYQGEPGAYSEMAVIDCFGRDVTRTGLTGFEDTFRALSEKQADYAILPIENSSTGGIRQVYDLLALYNCFIVGETRVHVHHCLMSLPGTRIEDIRTVYSHEQGLLQCARFLEEHPDWKQIPQTDTAGSARMIAQTRDASAAAICSSLAADIYGLEILKPNINTNQNNTTRFVVVSPKMELSEGRDKICISITTRHSSGSLHQILTIFALHGLNLVRLESRPIQGKRWEYMFFIEFTGDLASPGMTQVMLELTEASSDLRVFGNFPSNLHD